MQDILELEYPFIFLISVTVSIIVIMFSAFYYDQKNRKQVNRSLERMWSCVTTLYYTPPQKQHQKEVNLVPSEPEEMATTTEEEEEELSDKEQSDKEQSDEEEVPIQSFAGCPFSGGSDDMEESGGDADGLMSRLKSARLKEIEEALTEEQLKSEKE